MTPDEARRELRLALTRGRRARTKVSGELGTDLGVTVMITEAVAMALLADGDAKSVGFLDGLKAGMALNADSEIRREATPERFPLDGGQVWT